MAESTSLDPPAPSQVSSSLPSLARTRLTVLIRVDTQRSAPSDRTKFGAFIVVVPSVVVERFVVVQNWFNAARRLPRRSVLSTVSDRNFDIWRRETLLEGS